jgi:hypothetical protein
MGKGYKGIVWFVVAILTIIGLSGMVLAQDQPYAGTTVTIITWDTATARAIEKLIPEFEKATGMKIDWNVFAEPVVHVLTEQIEDITSGYVQKRIINIALSIGVGFAVALSMLRIVIPGIQLWHYLLPGFSAALLMTFFVPNLFVGIAFDSGGVASGPMTATFILAFSQGAASATQSANVLVDGFGMIAMVALTPLIALQIIGFIYKRKSGKRGI